MNTTLDVRALSTALHDQNADVFSDSTHHQYGVTIPCPECREPTRWIEEREGVFSMHPCGHTALPEER